MRRLVVQPQARLDLLEIWHYIATDSRQNADRVLASLEDALRDPQRMPGLGHQRADVRSPHYRFWTVHRFVIAYRFDEKTLTVVRVVHGSRDFRRLF